VIAWVPAELIEGTFNRYANADSWPAPRVRRARTRIGQKRRRIATIVREQS
jgi:hypothetical protein